MSTAHRQVDTMPERYDQALEYCHDKDLPPGCPRPRPTKDWPPENVALLVRYGEWLLSGGASELVTRTIYIPIAGHALGLCLKPHPLIDLQADLQPALDYVSAKGAGPDWSKACRNGLVRFRRFLLHERGQLETKIKPFDPLPVTSDLPAWLVEHLEQYQHLQQRNWRPARLQENIRRFWSGHLRLWRFLCHQCGVVSLSDLRRQHLFAYQDHRLENGTAISTLNADLRNFHSFLAFLQEQGFVVPQTLLRIPCLKQPESLPRYLTDEQVRLLRDGFEIRVLQVVQSNQRRDALLDRAVFYLLWHGGLRRGEVEELCLEDLDLPARRLTVRNGKGLKDRTVFLTDTCLHALEMYLVMRGSGPTGHVFLYRNQPLCKDLINGRLKAVGQRVGVDVYAHRLRHTCATQLLNAGCPVTSIQKFLGHKKLNTTMIYARAHDQTVEADYFAAMQRVEQRLEPVGEKQDAAIPLQKGERTQLLMVAEQLAAPELDHQSRLALVALMLALLKGQEVARFDMQPDTCAGREWIPPPASPALVGTQVD
jgi:site-specific recombinase XerD